MPGKGVLLVAELTCKENRGYETALKKAWDTVHGIDDVAVLGGIITSLI